MPAVLDRISSNFLASSLSKRAILIPLSSAFNLSTKISFLSVSYFIAEAIDLILEVIAASV